jgi:hypothetical protein
MKRLGYGRGQDELLQTARLIAGLAAAVTGVIWGIIRKHRRVGHRRYGSVGTQKIDAGRIMNAVRLSGYGKQSIRR